MRSAATSRVSRRAVTALTALAVVATLGGTAQADPICCSFWNNAHTLSQGGTYSQGDQIGMWQAVLASEALLPSKCYQDGLFGSTTRSGTISYQSRFGLTQDGIVGPQTWGKAATFAVFDMPLPGASYYDRYFYVGYDGRFFWLIRNAVQSPHYWAFRPYSLGSSDSRSGYWSSNHPTITFPPLC